MAHRTKNALALILGLGIAFLLGEIGMRAYYAVNDLTLAADAEERCKRSFYLEHLDSLRYKESLSTGTPSFIPHPLYGWTLKPKHEVKRLFGTELKNDSLVTGLSYEVHINNQSMRSFKDYSLEKEPGMTRIAAIGDSFTFGIDVSQGFSYPDILEAISPGTEVLNFGIESTGVGQMYLRFKEEALSFKPDVVFMGILIDDISRAARSCRSWLKPSFAAGKEGLEITGIPVPTPGEFMSTYRIPLLESYLMKHMLWELNQRVFVERTYEQGFGALELILDDMQRMADQQGFLLTAGVLSYEGETAIEKEYRGKLVALLEERGIPYADSEAAFRKASEEYKNQSFYLSSHFNNLGNALYAQEIRGMLEEQGAVEVGEDYLFRYNEDGLFKDILVMEGEDSGERRFIRNFHSVNPSLEMPVEIIPYPARDLDVLEAR